MSEHLKLVKPSTEAEKTTRTTTDTWEVSINRLKALKDPPFQRPLKINDKVRECANEIRESGGVIPGVIVIGVLDKQQYLIDGQHRREAFFISECLTGYCDVRVLHFDSMAEMGEEFVRLNSHMVALKPDDVLRGLEKSNPALSKLRRHCPFLGYDQIRRGDKSPVMSMSAALRCWIGSAPDTPKAGGDSALRIAQSFTTDEADRMIEFLELAMAAWGRDAEYHRLWLNLNMTLCMWLYRRLVVTPYSAKTLKITKDTFTELLMALSADPHYLTWLTGRSLRETDRSPCYNRIKRIFAARLEEKTGKKALLPAPPWASNNRNAL